MLFFLFKMRSDFYTLFRLLEMIASLKGHSIKHFLFKKAGSDLKWVYFRLLRNKMKIEDFED